MFLTDAKTIHELAGDAPHPHLPPLVQLANHLPALVYIKDLENRFTFANGKLCEELGLPLAEVIGKTTHEIASGEFADEHFANDMRVIRTELPLEVEEHHHSAGGDRTFFTQKVPIFDEANQVIGVAGISTDISDKRRSEISLNQNTRALRALSAVNEALVRERSESQLFGAICRAIVADDAYLLAWVGEARHDAGQTVVPVAAEGKASAYADGVTVTWGHGISAEGPTGRAVKTKSPVIVRDTETDEAILPWLDRTRTFAIRSIAAFPLQLSDGYVFGTLTIFAAEPDSFGPDEVEPLQRMADDLSYGIEAMRNRVWRERAELALRKSADRLEAMARGVIETLSSVVEMRDPYTQGHQRGVAQLSRRIAVEMGLPNESIETIEIGALVHDIGKLTVPTEILTKPSRLIPLEFELIKRHCVDGYDMLSHVDFGRPIAEIAWQHHERVDGSGYPRGLKGDEILMATRVIMVADVIEAMASDRPYRAALGVQAAVEEVLNNPHLFDPTVLAAVKRLYDRGDLRV